MFILCFEYDLPIFINYNIYNIFIQVQIYIVSISDLVSYFLVDYKNQYVFNNGKCLIKVVPFQTFLLKKMQ